MFTLVLSITERLRIVQKYKLEVLRTRKKNIEWLRTEIERLEQVTVPVSRLRIGARSTAPNDVVERMIDEKENLRNRYTLEVFEMLRDIREVERWCAGLSERDRLMIRLRFFDGLTWEQVAERFDVIPYTVRRWFDALELE